LNYLEEMERKIEAHRAIEEEKQPIGPRSDPGTTKCIHED